MHHIKTGQKIVGKGAKELVLVLVVGVVCSDPLVSEIHIRQHWIHHKKRTETNDKEYSGE
jgi:hypothetical protein